MSTASKHVFEIGTIAVLAVAGLGLLVASPISSPMNPTALRSVFAGMLQVIGILTGFVIVTYVFWTNGTVASFEEQAKSLPAMCEAMRQAGASRITLKCVRGLIGVELVRDISEPFKPYWLSRAPVPRPGDELKVVVDGFNEVLHTVLRRAYLIVLATVLTYSTLLTSYVFALGQSDSIAVGPNWLVNLAVFAFIGALTWVGLLLRLLLRPGSGVAIASTKENPDGTYTFIAPEGL